MTVDELYPYTLEVHPCAKPAGHFRWIIRERGKLVQRADKPHPSQHAALKSGRAELERIAKPGLRR